MSPLWLALVPQAVDPSPAWPELACRLGRFTPRVVCEADALLAEVAASLRLFGGFEALAAALEAEFAEGAAGSVTAPAPLQAVLAFAATPRAAYWLARAGHRVRCRDLAATLGGLDAVPLAVLPWPPTCLARCTALGVATLGALRALPRAGIQLRFGTAVARELAQALGELPDPRQDYVFPETFSLALELPAAVEAAPALRFAARRLLAALAGWLVARQLAVRALLLQIAHERRESTALPVVFSHPLRDPGCMEAVLAEHLGRLALPAAATGLVLEASQVEAQAEQTAGLFARHRVRPGEAASASDAGELAALLDRLQARFGAGAVHGLAMRAEHRPERVTVTGGSPLATAPERTTPGNAQPAGPMASAAVAAGGTSCAPSFPSRPLWLFVAPQALPERGGRPYYERQPLQLLAGPERIESGWWDGGDIRRDYFIAVDDSRRCFWIFRDGNNPGWYLHGLFS